MTKEISQLTRLPKSNHSLPIPNPMLQKPSECYHNWGTIWDECLLDCGTSCSWPEMQDQNSCHKIQQMSRRPNTRNSIQRPPRRFPLYLSSSISLVNQRDFEKRRGWIFLHVSRGGGCWGGGSWPLIAVSILASILPSEANENCNLIDFVDNGEFDFGEWSWSFIPVKRKTTPT